MKNTIIDEILNGYINNKFETTTKEYDLLSDKVIELENELKKRLSPELYKLLLNYSEASAACNNEELDRYFAEGFSCALRICFECFK